jgi:hypothetical protein
MANTVKKTIDKLKSIFAPPSKIVTYTSQIKGLDKVDSYTVNKNKGTVAGSTPKL